MTKVKVSRLDRFIYKGTKIIDGLKFRLIEGQLSRRAAEDLKKQIKTSGYSARIISKKDCYEVWAR